MYEPEPSAKTGPGVELGARAAGLLEEACRRTLSEKSSLRVEVVRDAARDLKKQLEAVSRLQDRPSPDLLAEAALRCADVANLAACNTPELAPREAPSALEAVRYAAAAVESLGQEVRAPIEALQDPYAANLTRDIRNATWRAKLALRQVEGLLGKG